MNIKTKAGISIASAALLISALPATAQAMPLGNDAIQVSSSLSTPVAPPTLAPQSATVDTNITNGMVIKTKTPITTQSELNRFLASAAPKRVTIDPATGSVVKVQDITMAEANAPMTVTPSVGAAEKVAPFYIKNYCDVNDACWGPDRTPYANYGVYSIGTHTQEMSHRDHFRTYIHTAQAHYRYNGTDVSYPLEGPNSDVDVTGYVQGIKIVVFS